MKKQLHNIILLTLSIVLFTSCKNDDIAITNIASSQTLSLDITTKQVYDELGISEYIKSYLLGGSNTFYNCVYTFVYDTQGLLVASDSTYSKTLGPISQQFSLKSGDYTIISVEFLVDEENDFKSKYWVLAGKEHLKDLMILNKETKVFWDGAIGYHAKKTHIDNSSSLNIKMQAVGSILQLEGINFDLSDYTVLCLITKDRPNGRFLSPDYIGDDRFYFDKYTPRGNWCMRGHVYNKNGLSENESFLLYLIEEGLIQYGMSPTIVNNNMIVNKITPYPITNNYITLEPGYIYYGGIAFIGDKLHNECDAFLGNKNEYIHWKNSLKRPN